MQEPNAQPSAAGSGGSVPVDDPRKLRLGYWRNITETVKHIRTSIAAEGKRIRASDYISIICLPVFSLLLAVFATNIILTPWRPLLVFVFFSVLLYFIGGRIGIMRSMSARETHLMFNILMATFMVGVTFSMLVFELIRNLP
jgi:hypothetical protein